MTAAISGASQSNARIGLISIRARCSASNTSWLQQELAQLARVLGARVGVADARQVQPHAGQAEPRVEVREQVDQLGVDRGVVGADRLRADLAVLAVAARLRRLVAEHRAGVPELHRLRQLVHAVLEIGAAHGRRALRAQRQRAAAAVLERVHLLAHDVGGLADRAHEQVGVLEDRGVDLAEAGALEQRPRLRHDLAPQGGPPGQQVVGAARGLVLRGIYEILPRRGAGPCAAAPAREGPASRSARRQLRQERVRAPLGAERRDPMWPGIDGRLLRQRLDQAADRGEQRAPSRRPGRSVRPTDPRNSTSPENTALLGGDRERQVAGAVTGREEHVDLEPRELELLAAAQRVVGLVALVRADARETARSA